MFDRVNPQGDLMQGRRPTNPSRSWRELLRLGKAFAEPKYAPGTSPGNQGVASCPWLGMSMP